MVEGEIHFAIVRVCIVSILVRYVGSPFGRRYGLRRRRNAKIFSQVPRLGTQLPS